MTGATGFVGRRLGHALHARGDRVLAVSRSPREAQALSFVSKACTWEQLGELGDVDAVVHLAGETVAQRWTSQARQKIFESRIGGAQKLGTELSRSGGRKVFLSASAVGFYGDRGDELLGESSAAGQGFLADVCQAWERIAREAAGTMGAERVVIFRFGMVLGEQGGALAKMLPAFRLGLGGRLGNGRQWLSWIHIDDLVRALLFALDTVGASGVYNAVAPAPVTNREFTRALGRALHRPAVLPVPAFALKLALGEMAEMLLGSQRVEPGRLIAEGFSFRYPRIIEALEASLHGGP
ncbi:MAG TPA: TIGR01777 family oxidoreductase [Bdellovibrionota bacterium]